MKIIHRVSVTVDEKVMQKLVELGLEPQYVMPHLVSFDIDESDPGWSKARLFIEKSEALDVTRTEFSSNELKQARRLQMGASWHHGYPQPEGAFGYLNATYDLTSYCRSCGVGKKQKAPFRMKRDPKWGKKHVLQLNWVHDDFFVLPDIWKTIFRPFGIPCLPVLNHRTGEELETVVQLRVDSEATSAIRSSDHEWELCSSCNRKKYLPITRGSFPAVEVPSDIHMAKTREYFGSGASAWRAIIISAELYQEIEKQKIKGAEFQPVDVGSS
jgi:hypothetical protein